MRRIRIRGPTGSGARGHTVLIGSTLRNRCVLLSGRPRRRWLVLRGRERSLTLNRWKMTRHGRPLRLILGEQGGCRYGQREHEGENHCHTGDRAPGSTVGSTQETRRTRRGIRTRTVHCRPDRWPFFVGGGFSHRLAPSCRDTLAGLTVETTIPYALLARGSASVRSPRRLNKACS